MDIEYQIKRFDLVKIYFHNLRYSKRTQLILFGFAGLLFLLILFVRFLTYGKLLASDFGYAFLWALVFFLVIPLMLLLTAKTQKRWLSIGQEGIETKIGSQKGKISWKAVDSIVDAKGYIYVIGKNANAFSIPNYAFENDDSRNEFLDLATKFHVEVNSPTGK